jgi:hypothetical protein
MPGVLRTVSASKPPRRQLPSHPQQTYHHIFSRERGTTRSTTCECTHLDFANWLYPDRVLKDDIDYVRSMARHVDNRRGELFSVKTAQRELHLWGVVVDGVPHRHGDPYAFLDPTVSTPHDCAQSTRARSPAGTPSVASGPNEAERSRQVQPDARLRAADPTTAHRTRSPSCTR